ncbi:MAG: hypothetical protein J6S63_01485 [Atopobiaceae bacterium]|nr:hypothetical protein [Atopobiaceae bacterium]
MLETVLPGLLQGLTLAVVTAIGGALIKLYRKMTDEYTVLKDSQRQQIKSDIVTKYQEVSDRGYITPMELDVMCRSYESYQALGGNTYIDALVKQAKNMPIKGTPIPDGH